MTINRDKSNVVIFGSNPNINTINNIKVVSSFKYLGVTLGEKKDCYQEHKEEKIKMAKRMANMTYSVVHRLCNKLMIGKTYWASVVLPSVLFASSVITWNKKEL